MQLQLIEQICLAVVIIGIVALFFTSPNITGLVSSEVFKQGFDVQIDQSTKYSLHVPEGLTLQSLSLSGSTEGTGAAYLFLETGNHKRRLIYTNVHNINQKALSQITGTAVADVKPEAESKGQLVVSSAARIEEEPAVSKGNVAVQGVFTDACVETCLLPAGVQSDELALVALIDKGTVLILKDIKYRLG